MAACPFGVIERRERDGRAHKCTLCYDRLHIGEEPACAKACPTQSITFGPIPELLTKAERRLANLRAEGRKEARLYGVDDTPGVGGTGAFFLLLDEPEAYGLPSHPVTPTKRAREEWAAAGVAAVGLLIGVAAAFFGSRR